MTTEHYIEHRNLSVAWGRALQLSWKPVGEVAPLVVSITGFDDHGHCEETASIRAAVDNMLAASGKQSVETVANTIFPASLWNPAAGRKVLFDRFRRVANKMHQATRKNSRGTYFERMVVGGASGAGQLEHILDEYQKRDGVRRSILQLGIFDPNKDHSTAAQVGFPCLQHVTFAPLAGDLLNVNAFYATQYLGERAYGNYLGLCRLGRFVAHELGLRLTRLTCMIGIAKRDLSKNVLEPALRAVEDVDGSGHTPGDGETPDVA